MVIDLAKIIQIKAAYQALAFISIKFSVKVLAETQSNVGQTDQPFMVFWVEFRFTVDDTNIYLHTVFIFNKLLNSGAEFQVRAYQDNALFGIRDGLLYVIIQTRCIENLDHKKPRFFCNF
ncbi:Uncharacterised protein [Klebsiella pneumoniae]|nr:Uncharacterised protein [Klebsiella pneumoniae]